MVGVGVWLGVGVMVAVLVAVGVAVKVGVALAVAVAVAVGVGVAIKAITPLQPEAAMVITSTRASQAARTRLPNCPDPPSEFIPMHTPFQHRIQPRC